MDDKRAPGYKPETPTVAVSSGISGPPTPETDKIKAGTAPGAATGSEGGSPGSASPDAEMLTMLPGATLPPRTPTRSAESILSPGSSWGGAPLNPGSVFANRYEIVVSLGEGGMGAVYKARDLELDRDVALKVIRPELSRNPEILQRFKQELILARQVTDRNIIRIFDLGEADGIKFITMEYIDGRNLHQILRQQGKLEVAEAVGIMEQVAAGLAAAHREGIIHRDLKPGNIMRDSNGRVVVMDFGLARAVEGDGMTRTGAMLGTMEYMSPEQAQGKELKPSSDIFTLGLILYELLSGSSPFQAESAIASLLMRTQQLAVPLVDIDKKIPGSLSNIVSKCLEKDPANRYQSAAELDADLRAWQGRGNGQKVSATAARMRMNRIRELPWTRFAITGALILAVIAGIDWVLARRQQSTNAGAPAQVSVLVADFSNLTGDPLLDNTIEPMLGQALEGASFVNLFSRTDARRLAAKLPHSTGKLDEQSARLIAVNQDINAVITGEISLRGDEYDISAIALDATTGKVLAKSEISVANKQQILSKLPKLAVPIRKALGDSTPASKQFDEVAGGFKAASLEAVHQASIAVDEQFAGKFQEAFDSFQKAATIDPNLTWAYTGMGAMAENLGRSEDAVKYMKIAMEHVDNMTDREKYRDRGLYYRTTGDWQDCVQEYTQLVSHYPADRVGQNNLAICYVQLRNAPKALEAAKRAVQLAPKAVSQHATLAYISAFAGDFAGSEGAARAALSINPSAAQGFLSLAEAQLAQGQTDNAAASYQKLETLDPFSKSIGAAGLADLATYEGKYADAARILSQGAAADTAANLTDNAARKYVALGNLEEILGNHAAAISDTDKALAMSHVASIEFLAARTYVANGEIAKAQQLSTSLSAELSGESQAYGKIVAGLIALKQKNTNEAVTQIRAANNLLDTWIGRLDLGRTYLEAGLFTEADSEFDQCIKRRGEALELFDDNVPTYAYLPPAYYYEGRVRQGMNSNGFADFYKTYLGIRGRSPEDPMVSDIHHRIGQ